MFALFSKRLALDPCLLVAESLPLAHKAVRSYMRIVKSLDQASGTLVIVGISEPIPAIAAMDILNATQDTWPDSIGTLIGQLF